MTGLNWKAIEGAAMRHDPYDHILLSDSLTPAAAAAIPAEYPEIKRPGSFPLAEAQPGPVLADVIADLNSDRFRAMMSKLFDVDLEGRPTTVTLRGRCGDRDGNIHTDSKSKILTLLLYLNEGWTGGDGQLRLLRNGHDLEAAAAEVPPTMGTMLVFKRTDHSWHGHTRYIGPRRVLQFNYVQSEKDSVLSRLRHGVSAFAKQRAAM
jgi:hypothetical protein